MAAVSVLSVMNGGKGLLSFFSRSNETATVSSPRPKHLDTESPAHSEDNDGTATLPTKPCRNAPKRREEKLQKTLHESYPSILPAPPPNVAAEEHATGLLPADPDVSRRKRRRTGSHESIEVGRDVKSAGCDTPSSAQGSEGITMRHMSPEVVIPVSTLPPVNAPTPAPRTPPKRMLRLNASGKFRSPITKKTEPDGDTLAKKRYRGNPKSLIVKCAYSSESAIGARIDNILSGAERKEVTSKATTKRARESRKKRRLKPMHPFFLEKPSEESLQKQHSPRKTSAVTPGKLKRQALGDRIPLDDSASTEVFTSALLKDRLIARHPGAKEPLWPCRGISHCRNLDAAETTELRQVFGVVPSYATRKKKAARRPFPPDESILTHLTQNLAIEKDGELRSDGFRNPHPSLRLPTKQLSPCPELAELVKRELSSCKPNITGESTSTIAFGHTDHTAIKKLLGRIASELNAFDEGRGEPWGWAQKYAPITAEEVLQPMREMSILKDWLSRLTVSAVERTTKSESNTVQKPDARSKKKRRTKHSDLDDFLVDDDEEIHDLELLSNPDEGISSEWPSNSQSVVQSLSFEMKMSNTVLLSGPHGCGKSAAAYAIAKELGFKVFEINASERRSGKDVLDRVGDMTENHLVRHHATESGEVSAAEEPSRNDEAFQRDLASGRQGKMSAFFKPKTSFNKAVKAKTLATIQKAIKAPAKDQQQSLVLLEEVDVLFKEDKEFWTTVMRLISTSKRPFIITCNDEDLVPLQALSLHAVLRLRPPPLELAADYLLLMAAAEGHQLQREAVTFLYQSKENDLRASITELNFWCQMGIGDPRGGLSWIFQRWPPNSDQDNDGQRLRVVSGQTYQRSMGLLPNYDLDQASQLLWAHEEYAVETVDIVQGQIDHESRAASLTLKQYSCLLDSESMTDLYGLSNNTSPYDMTRPPMKDKARAQYTEGMALLQTDEHAKYSHLTEELSITSTLLAYTIAGLWAPQNLQGGLEAAVETKSTARKIADQAISRRDFVCFDTLTEPAEPTNYTSNSLSLSVLDGPFGPITTDIAPYVRQILYSEAVLSEQRERLSYAIRGPNSKKSRTTRAARSALEGSQRESTRREKWFPQITDPNAVLATGGRDWPRIGMASTAGDGSRTSREGTEAPTSSAEQM